jgi:hypothetical protein
VSCGTALTEENTFPSHAARGSGECRSCRNATQKSARWAKGGKRFIAQEPGKLHTFPKCGCTGILPERGQSNKFAVWMSRASECRVALILRSSTRMAKSGGFQAIDPKTPHSVIRALMEEPNCERCQQPLSWNHFGWGKTPHLHHDHETGEIYGFTHPRCNPNALEIEIDRLKEEIRKLKAAKAA